MSWLVPRPSTPTWRLAANGMSASNTTPIAVTTAQPGRTGVSLPFRTYAAAITTATASTMAVVTARPGSLIAVADSAKRSASPAAGAAVRPVLSPQACQIAAPQMDAQTSTSAVAAITPSTGSNILQWCV